MKEQQKKAFVKQTMLSRRTFLKGSAGAIAAALSASAGGKFLSQGMFAPRIARAQSNTVVLAIQEFTHDILRGVLPEFEAATGLTVQLEGGPVSGNDMLTRYASSFASGESPVDVMSDADDSSPTFMRAGWVQPLNDIIPQETWDDFPNSMKDHIDGFLSIDGVRYRIPHEFAVGYFFNRQDWLDEKGLSAPATWEELVNAGKEFSDPANGVWGTTDGLIKPALLYVFIAYLTAQAGGKVFEFDEATGDALQFLHDMIHTHKIFPETALNNDYTAQNELYMADKVAFMRQWPFFQGVAEGNADWFAPEKIVISVPPAGPAGSKSWIGGWGFSIPTFAPNPDGAAELIRFLTSKEIAPVLAEQQGFLLTPRASILEVLDQENPLVQAMSLYAAEDVFAARPFHPRVAEAQTVVDDMASLFLSNQASLSDVLQQGKDLIAALDQ
ncbi:MAG: extracellular solute-binding protein [Anaerolineae bacterium]|nr:extracellular solute-binding protein [Anaerolineae bacterium]